MLKLKYWNLYYLIINFMKKIKENIVHYLSRLNPENEFNAVRKFAKNNY